MPSRLLIIVFVVVLSLAVLILSFSYEHSGFGEAVGEREEGSACDVGSPFVDLREMSEMGDHLDGCCSDFAESRVQGKCPNDITLLL